MNKINNLIKIGNQRISVKEYNNQRVVTFKDVDSVHERPEGTARKRFSDNRKHFVEGEDYFKISPSEFRTAIGDMDVRQQNDITLLTESGYLMLVKSFTDDLAWQVQRQLVKFYFSRKTLTISEQIQLIAKGNIELEQKIDSVNEDLQEFKKDMPLLALECQRITRAKNQKVIPLMGGKNSPAYKDKSLRTKVYTDIDSQLRREFGVNTYKAIKRNQCDIAIEIINGYELPMTLAEQIKDSNAQMSICEE